LHLDLDLTSRLDGYRGRVYPRNLIGVGVGDWG